MWRRIKKYLLLIFIILLSDFALAGIISLIAKLKTIEGYCSVLFYLGAGILAIGFFSITGEHQLRGRISYQNAKTISGGVERRVKDDIDTSEKSMNFALLTVCVGGISILMSLLIGYFAAGV